MSLEVPGLIFVRLNIVYSVWIAWFFNKILEGRFKVSCVEQVQNLNKNSAQKGKSANSPPTLINKHGETRETASVQIYFGLDDGWSIFFVADSCERWKAQSVLLAMQKSICRESRRIERCKGPLQRKKTYLATTSTSGKCCGPVKGGSRRITGQKDSIQWRGKCSGFLQAFCVVICRIVRFNPSSK